MGTRIFSDETLEHYGLTYTDDNELVHSELEEVENEDDDTLAHFGKKGMKWGQRTAGGPHGITGKPGQIKALGFGIYGNKSHFTDPAALAQRKKAGKLRIAALSTAVLGSAISNIGGKSPSTAVGAKVAGTILSAGASGLGLASLVNASQAITKQNVANG